VSLCVPQTSLSVRLKSSYFHSTKLRHQTYSSPRLLCGVKMWVIYYYDINKECLDAIEYDTLN
jgi:hypothetical protein